MNVNASISKYLHVTHISHYIFLKIAEQESLTLIESQRDELQPAFIRQYHASTLQWLLYCDYIDAKSQLDSKHVDYLAIFDVSSTVFQLDPFQHLLSQNPKMDDLYVFTESGGKRIGEVSNIVAIASSCFGISVTKDIQDKVLLSSRVVAGSYGSIRSYLDKMKAILLNKGDGPMASALPLKLADSTYLLSDVPSCEREGLGTVAHNLIVYADLLKTPFPLNVNVNIEGESGESFLAYILPTDFSNIRQNAFNSASEAFDERSRQVVSTVLDYSQNFIMSQNIMDAYLPSIHSNSSVSEYEHTSTCRRYTFVPSRDVFHRICDVVAFKALTSASCCHLCNSYERQSRDKNAGKGCNGFTFLHGENLCRLKSCLEKDIKNIVHSEMQEGMERMKKYRMVAKGGVSAYLTPTDKVSEPGDSDDGLSRARSIND